MVTLSGGVTLRVGGVAFISRTPLRPLLVTAALLIAARALLGAASFARARAQAIGSREQRPARIAVVLSLAVFVFTAAWNTWAAGGSDSSCYVLQADAFAHGRVTLPPPLPEWPPGLAAAAFAPAGFLPSGRTLGEAVPICGPGLALAMALPSLIHRDAVFLVVPFTAALLVWFTFAFGRLLAGDRVAVCAAAWLAASPIFLYQAVQPMSDVPAAAAWLAALVYAARGSRRDWLVAGVCASLAILTRANLALIVLPLLLLKNGDSPHFERGKQGVSPFLWFAAGLAPGVLVMLALNVARYGGPLASGYGDTGVLFAWAHVAPNLARYPRWLLETQTPIVLLALGAPWIVRRDPTRFRLVVVSLTAVALLIGTYLAYTVFNDWWYIRFLLPALPVLIVCATLVLARMFEALPPYASRHALPIAAALLAGFSLDVAGAHHVFQIQGLEARFRLTGEYTRYLPANIVMLAAQQSGSVRYHGGRATLAWDAIAPGELDAVIAWFRAHGRLPLIAVEDQETERFRSRFGDAAEVGHLDWPPDVEVHGRVRVRIFNPARRVEYKEGGQMTTEHIRSEAGSRD